MLMLARRDPSLAMSSEEFEAEFSASGEQMDNLQAFYRLLTEWSQRMNLVGPTALADFWLRHVYDSAQLLHVEQSGLTWADVGAGAGFPGIVLAILLKYRDGACVHLIESTSKRVGFLKHTAATLSLPVKVHHARAESLPAPVGLEVVTARACAPLSRLLDYTAHFFHSGAKGVFLKGRGVETELEMARQRWTFDSSLIRSFSDPEGRILQISRLKANG